MKNNLPLLNQQPTPTEEEMIGFQVLQQRGLWASQFILSCVKGEDYAKELEELFCLTTPPTSAQISRVAELLAPLDVAWFTKSTEPLKWYLKVGLKQGVFMVNFNKTEEETV